MAKEIELAPGKWVGGSHPCFIIAEVGQNHQGDMDIAKSLIRAAKVSADALYSLAVPFMKIGSGDTNNFPLLQHVATKKVPLVVSTGMQNMETVHSVYNLLTAAKSQFCLLHCVSAYPTPAEDVNLRVIQTYKQEFPDTPIGYSGHELGTAISVAAVAMGAQVLERHITLDKSWKGSDHVCSLTPLEFLDLVNQVRIVEAALGNSIKQFQPSEEPCYNKLGKTLVAARDLSAGDHITADSVKVKVAEPKGCPAERYNDIIGKELVRDVQEDESIMSTDVI
ncbi:Sialic acid synthase [Zootermopsis nevadensis]|uniref:Sialic acid synthase n=1 Tax=Zootermopsis nevadensis TaxID=136037 RepID=A0A067R9R0_ZOONE|nr:Sialic acid synthase [Zootermopsis nevadensis]